eukprot:363346-Chlamydomonas_euryale.AAC.1
MEGGETSSTGWMVRGKGVCVCVWGGGIQLRDSGTPCRPLGMRRPSPAPPLPDLRVPHTLRTCTNESGSRKPNV